MSDDIKGQKKKSQASQDVEDLKATIAALEARLATGEEGAMERVCKALKIDPKSLKEEGPKEPEQLVEIWVETPVRVNSQIYHGRVKVPYSTFEVIAQAVGARRMRIMREATGSKYVIDELSGGGMNPRLIETTTADGERISR